MYIFTHLATCHKLHNQSVTIVVLKDIVELNYVRVVHLELNVDLSLQCNSVFLV